MQSKYKVTVLAAAMPLVFLALSTGSSGVPAEGETDVSRVLLRKNR